MDKKEAARILSIMLASEHDNVEFFDKRLTELYAQVGDSTNSAVRAYIKKEINDLKDRRHLAIQRREALVTLFSLLL